MWLRDLTVTISFYSWVRPGEVFSKIKTGMQSVSDESLWDSELCKSLEVFEKILMSRWFYESCSQAPWPRDEGSWSWPTVPTFHRQWYQARWYFPPASLSSYFCSNIFIQSQCKIHLHYQVVSMFPVHKTLDGLLYILHRHTNLRWNISPCCKHVNHCTRQRIRIDSSSPNE